MLLFNILAGLPTQIWDNVLQVGTTQTGYVSIVVAVTVELSAAVLLTVGMVGD